MQALINAALESRWESAPPGTDLLTPSETKHFTVVDSLPEEIRIRTEGGTQMTLRYDAFAKTLAYLAQNNHVAGNPCLVSSNKAYRDAGPLCRAARDANEPDGGTMVITYVLPILKKMGLVEIDHAIPNSTWLA